MVAAEEPTGCTSAAATAGEERELPRSRAGREGGCRAAAGAGAGALARHRCLWEAFQRRAAAPSRPAQDLRRQEPH